MAYADAVLANSPYAYWKHDETGSTCTDSSGNGRTLTYGSSTAKPTLGTAGIVDGGSCADFDGSNDFASVGSIDVGGQKLTLEWWANAASWTNNDKLWFEHSANFNLNANTFIVNPNDSGQPGYFSMGMHNGSAVYDEARWVRPAAGEWHYYAAVFDRSKTDSTRMMLYIDGVLLNSVTRTTRTSTANFSSQTVYMMSRAGASLFAPGKLDDVAIYAAVLTAEQIATHYTAGLARFGNRHVRTQAVQRAATR